MAKKVKGYASVPAGTVNPKTFTNLVVPIILPTTSDVKKILLNKNQNFFYLKKNIFHSNYARSKHSIHIESISGPFNRKTDRIYG